MHPLVNFIPVILVYTTSVAPVTVPLMNVNLGAVTLALALLTIGCLS